jgi:hypothetical protein
VQISLTDLTKGGQLMLGQCGEIARYATKTSVSQY